MECDGGIVVLDASATTTPNRRQGARGRKRRTDDDRWDGSKAVNPWNQPLVDRLTALVEKFKGDSRRDKLALTAARARRSVAARCEEIRSAKDLASCKHVGPFLSRSLQDTLCAMLGSFDPGFEAVVSPRAPSGGIVEAGRKRPLGLESTSTANIKHARRRLASSSTARTSATTKVDFERRQWEVVLLLDARETGGHTERHFFLNRLRERGIRVDTRGVPLGDYLWIAREISSSSSCSAGSPSQPPLEYVLDVVIERKTVDDLVTSIKDGRYHEQKHRLTTCGLRRVLYLVEGDTAKPTAGVAMGGTFSSAAMLSTAVWETRVHSGLQIIETSNREETVAVVADIHRALERTFMDCATMSRWQCEDHAYEAFKRRVAKGRSSNSSITELWSAMLAQIPGCGSDAVAAITSAYPTPTALARAYFHNRSPADGDRDAERRRRFHLLSGLCLADKRRVGPVLSQRVARLVCQREYLVESIGDCSSLPVCLCDDDQ